MTIASPCKRICKIDTQGKYCLGCFRTSEEIINWGKYTDDQKSAVLDRINTLTTSPGTPK